MGGDTLKPRWRRNLLIVMRTVLPAPIRMEDAVVGRRPERGSYLLRPDCQVALYAIADCPADHAP